MRLSFLMLMTLIACNESNPNRSFTPNPGTPNRDAVETGTGALRSQLHRLLGTVILTSAQEAESADSLRVGYDNIPDLADSDDGTGATPSVNLAGRPQTDCGIDASLTTIDARIADCSAKNAERAIWRGQANGNAGEGNWLLVVRQLISGERKEVWLDATTGYLWSDQISTTNWCSASGNSQDALANSAISCRLIQDGINICVGQTIQGLGGDTVSWRLPTRGDFLNADLNGARYVLNRTAVNYWTATVNGDNRDQAWTILQANGVMTPVARNESRGVRCLGRRLP